MGFSFCLLKKTTVAPPVRQDCAECSLAAAVQFSLQCGVPRYAVRACLGRPACGGIPGARPLGMRSSLSVLSSCRHHMPGETPGRLQQAATFQTMPRHTSGFLLRGWSHAASLTIKGGEAKTRPPETLKCSQSKACKPMKLKLCHTIYLMR